MFDFFKKKKRDAVVEPEDEKRVESMIEPSVETLISRDGERLGIAFSVDSVLPELETPESGADVWANRSTTPVLFESHAFRAVDAIQHPNALVGAVHYAFAKHRILTLSPDMIWLTISQGFSNHINANSEELRARFVRHQGKRKLTVETMSISQEVWSEVVPQFVNGMVQDVGPGIANLFENSFSTTDDTSRLASQMIMMDAFQEYFEFELMCICGIPNIRLLGTEEDWIEIRKRVDVIAEYDLSWWTDALAPICDQFVQASAGNIDSEFWRRIYKPTEAYGGDIATGWITNLFPYLRQDGEYAATRVNHLLQIPVAERTASDGIRGGSFPASVCDVPVRIVYPDGSKSEYRLMAGIAGAVYDESSQSIIPEIGWAVREGEAVDLLIEGIGSKFEWTERENDPDFQPPPGPKFLRKIFGRFEQPIRIDDFEFESDGNPNTKVLIDDREEYGKVFGNFDDGRVLARVGYGEATWAVGTAVHTKHEYHTETVVTATDLFNDGAELLSWLADRNVTSLPD